MSHGRSKAAEAVFKFERETKRRRRKQREMKSLRCQPSSNRIPPTGYRVCARRSSSRRRGIDIGAAREMRLRRLQDPFVKVSEDRFGLIFRSSKERNDRVWLSLFRKSDGEGQSPVIANEEAK